MKTGTISLNTSALPKMRLDAHFSLSDGLVSRRYIQNTPYEIKTIEDVTDNIYCPGIFKRSYVNKGTPFLGGSDINKQEIYTGKFLLKATTPNYEILKASKNTTLVTCGGTIGKTAFVNDTLSSCLMSQHVMRVIPSSNTAAGYLYAYLSSKYGYLLLTTNVYGSVIDTINADSIKKLPIPMIPDTLQKIVNDKIQECAKLRDEADCMVKKARKLLFETANIPEIEYSDYDFFGSSIPGRNPSTFVRSNKEIGSLSFHAFNWSERNKNLENKIKCQTIKLKEALLDGDFFSTGSFPRVEVGKGHGIMLINQRDIFDNIIVGKNISRNGVKLNNLVEYGEIIIAGVGTLGEGESFGRTLFAYEDLVGQLISGEFIRMKTNDKVPSGYLYAWLSSDFGFRLIRSTHAGSKLCRPIQKLLLEKPVPIIEHDVMVKIDQMIKEAFTNRHISNLLEKEAIGIVEQEIEKWNN